jgi:SAM-dependent methyltransferase
MNNPLPARPCEDALNPVVVYRVIGLFLLAAISASLAWLVQQLAWPWVAVSFFGGVFAGVFVGFNFGVHTQVTVATMAVTAGFLEGTYRGWQAYGLLGAVLGGPAGVLAGVVLVMLMLMSMSVLVILCGGHPFVNGFPEESSGGLGRRTQNLSRKRRNRTTGTTMAVPDRSTFESAYAGQAPWDIDKPQPALVAVADQITGSILDAGCGTGENALYFAGLGYKVTGIDFLAEPIERAKQKATERNLKGNFLVMDALALKSLPEVFDSAIDSGLFHVFDDADRRRYVEGLATVLRSGGRLFLLCFSDEEPGTQGPRRVSRREIEEAFADGWTIETIEPIRFEVRSDLENLRFSAGGPKAWFSVIRREG